MTALYNLAQTTYYRNNLLTRQKNNMLNNTLLQQRCNNVSSRQRSNNASSRQMSHLNNNVSSRQMPHLNVLLYGQHSDQAEYKTPDHEVQRSDRQRQIIFLLQHLRSQVHTLQQTQSRKHKYKQWSDSADQRDRHTDVWHDEREQQRTQEPRQCYAPPTPRFGGFDSRGAAVDKVLDDYFVDDGASAEGDDGEGREEDEEDAETSDIHQRVVVTTREELIYLWSRLHAFSYRGVEKSLV